MIKCEGPIPASEDKWHAMTSVVVLAAEQPASVMDQLTMLTALFDRSTPLSLPFWTFLTVTPP